MDLIIDNLLFIFLGIACFRLYDLFTKRANARLQRYELSSSDYNKQISISVLYIAFMVTGYVLMSLEQSLVEDQIYYYNLLYYLPVLFILTYPKLLLYWYIQK